MASGDTPGQPGPGRLGAVPGRGGGPRAPGPVRLSTAAVALALLRGGVVAPQGPAPVVEGPQRGVVAARQCAGDDPVDNEKIAVARGAGMWGKLNEPYRRYALTLRFHIDPCAPRSPESKGKVERRIRDHRLHDDPRRRVWSSRDALQLWTDARMAASAARRRCPATGTSVAAAWRAGAAVPGRAADPARALRRRGPAPRSPRLHGAVQGPLLLRAVRAHRAPIEVHGCAGEVQILAGCEVVDRHPRHTQERVLIEPKHFEGEATPRVLPPLPLGRMGRRLQEIAAMPPEVRPLDLEAALAPVAR